MRLASPLLALLIVAVLACPFAWADTIELVSGSRVEGKVLQRDATAVTVETQVGDRKVTRKYPLDRVAAITIDGQREVIGVAGPAAPPKPAEGRPATRTKAEVEALIEAEGRAAPEWFGSTPLEYPRTLDLTWPAAPPRDWNNQRNLGQYTWDIINPNPGRWRGGVRLMHHVLSVNEKNPSAQRRAMGELGRMYFNLLQDYPRAAFWWRQASAQKGDAQGSDGGIYLAECYWRLGNKQMAVDLLGKLPPTFSMIKLWADMGETERALQMAEANARGQYADIALIYAGDACRVAGKHREALAYYQRVLEVPQAGRGQGRIERNRRRASANIEGIRLYDLLDVSRVPDGTYRAASFGYEANVHVEVVVKSQRIESVKVIDHREKQYYASMTDIPRKIVQRQSVKGIDATSGATMTAEAILNATAKALSAAMK